MSNSKNESPLKWTMSSALRLAVLGENNSEVFQWVKEAGHECKLFTSEIEIEQVCKQSCYDAALIDIKEEDASARLKSLGSLCQVCNFEQPVIVVSPCESEFSIVEALEAGATEFIAKPVNRVELLARLRTLKYKPIKNGSIQEYEPYTFDLASRQLFINGNSVELTTREFSLALYLFHNAGSIVLRRKILADIWGISNNIDTRRVDTYISRIRSKLGFNLKDCKWRINSIYQKGYILEKKPSIGRTLEQSKAPSQQVSTLAPA